MFWRSEFCLALVATSMGCQPFGVVRLNEVGTAAGKPNNVATIVTVSRQGQPVSTLSASAFKVTENGQPLDNTSIELRLLEPTRVAKVHTVLLLDLSHATSVEERQQFSDAVGYFVRAVRAKQPVTVLGFDGTPKTRLIAEFPVDPSGSGNIQIAKQLPAKTDPSRDLRGAVVQALDLLDQRLDRQQLDKAGNSPRIGTVVIFSRGPDASGRVSTARLEERVKRSEHQLVLINVAGDLADDQVAALSADRQVHALALESLPVAFEQAASTVEKLLGHYYLVSYCSPARGQLVRLGLEVQVVGDDLEVYSDRFETEFDASNFLKGCSSANPPRFEKQKAAR